MISVKVSITLFILVVFFAVLYVGSSKKREDVYARICGFFILFWFASLVWLTWAW